MTLLAYDELITLVEHEVITGVTFADVNSSSIDITLGTKILHEKHVRDRQLHTEEIYIKAREPLKLEEHDLSVSPYYLLNPGEFVLAHSAQIFNLPNWLSAEYKLKSSLARCGLEHLNAGWCDAGWHGSALTLELKNMTQNHVLVLEPGMPIGQIVFFKHTLVPDKHSYANRGRYNNDTTVKQIKE